MTAIPQLPTRPTAFVPKPHRWTCEDFHNMGDAGFLEGRSVILVDGEILDMPNPNPPHNGTVGIVDCKMREVFGPGHWSRVQSSFATGLDTDPVPDIAIVTGTARDYLQRDPTTALLVVEISDSSLAYDLGPKSHLYAAAGIADYWVVDVNTPQLFVFRDPVADASAPRGFRYNTTLTLARGQSVVPLAAPHATVQVNDLLP